MAPGPEGKLSVGSQPKETDGKEMYWLDLSQFFKIINKLFVVRKDITGHLFSFTCVHLLECESGNPFGNLC